MLTAGKARSSLSPLSKNEQDPGVRKRAREKGALLLESLKALEVELQNRGVLPHPGFNAFNPLWFLAETERNIFLWRRGCSIIQRDEFEFWIDVKALVQKRLRQLENFDAENPFLNTFWGNPVQDTVQAERESSYLKSLLEILLSIENHAHAMCEVSSIVLREISYEASIREPVVLPSGKGIADCSRNPHSD